jgi:hypothetical protein
MSYSIAEDDNKYPTVGTIPKSNIKIVERGKIDTPNTQRKTLKYQLDLYHLVLSSLQSFR